MKEILQFGLYSVRFVPGAESVPYLFVILSAVIAYLLGSINSAVLISHLLYREDIRKQGSGNAGLTNMLRVYGKNAAILTLVGDMSKTVVSVVLAGLFFGFRYRMALSFSPLCWIAAIFCIIGHIKPVYYRFRGGKGVLSTATAILLLAPPAFLILFATFALIVWLTKYVSLGSIVSAGLLPLTLQGYMQAFIYTGDEEAFYDPGIFFFAIIFAVIVIVCHRKNIGRLWRHEENKLSFRKKDKEDATGGQ